MFYYCVIIISMFADQSGYEKLRTSSANKRLFHVLSLISIQRTVPGEFSFVPISYITLLARDVFVRTNRLAIAMIIVCLSV